MILLVQVSHFSEPVYYRMIKNKNVSPSAGSECSLALSQLPDSCLWNSQAKFSISWAIKMSPHPPLWISFFFFPSLEPIPQFLLSQTLPLQISFKSWMVLALFVSLSTGVIHNYWYEQVSKKMGTCRGGQIGLWDSFEKVQWTGERI